MGEKRWVLMSDLFCLFLVCMVVGALYFCDGGEKVGFFTGSILNREEKPFGEVFEEWRPRDDEWVKSSEYPAEIQPVFIGRGVDEGAMEMKVLVEIWVTVEVGGR